MADRTIGIEIGSQAVRLVRLSGSGKNLLVEQYREEPLLDTDPGDRVLAALKRLGQARLFSAETIAASLPGGPALTTTLSLPFSDAKVIEQVLPSQLSGKLPVGDEHVLAFAVQEKRPNSEEHEVLVVAYPKDVLAARLDTLSSAGCDPQIATVLHLSEHRAARLLNPGEQRCYGLLDLGRSSAVLTLMQGDRFLGSRVLLVGGEQVSAAIAEAFAVEPAAAEDLKRRNGFVAPEGQELAWYQQIAERGGFETAFSQPIAELALAVRQGLTPLLVGLRQSLASLAVQRQVELEFLLVCGGGARLRGLPQYLSQALGIDVRPVRLEGAAFAPVAANPLAQPEMVSALSLALCAADAFGGGLDVNLRRGKLAYKGVLEFFKEQAFTFAALGLSLVLALGFMLFMQYRATDLEREQLRGALADATAKLFGSEMLDKTAIETELEGSRAYTFVPERTAFDHLEWISNNLTEALPESEFEFEMLEIDTLRKVVTIKGDTDSDETVPQIMSVLERYECFPSQIAEPKTQKVRGRVVFQLRIEADRCYANPGQEVK